MQEQAEDLYLVQEELHFVSSIDVRIIFEWTHLLETEEGLFQEEQVDLGEVLGLPLIFQADVVHRLGTYHRRHLRHHQTFLKIMR